MRWSVNTAAAAAAASLLSLVASAPAAAATASNSNSTTTPYSKQMAASIMSRSQGIMTGAGGSSELLQAGITQKAFTALVAQYQQQHDGAVVVGSSSSPDFTARVQQYIVRSAASVAPFVSNASFDALSYPMDRLSNGNALLTFSQSSPAGNLSAVDYGAAAEALRDSIDLNRRNNESGLWYYVYPYWSYLDGMYSLAPFYTQYTLSSASSSNGNSSTTTTAALDDMLLQLDLLWQHCHNETSGLLVHGYDATRTAVWADPTTGASPHVWGRSLGWYAMALVDTLEILSSSSSSSSSSQKTGLSCKVTKPYTTRLADLFAQLASALVAAVDPASGAWWQVLDQPGRAGNYIESSGSAMFAYALLKGSRLGYLGGALGSEAVAVGSRARGYLTDTFVVNNGNGTLGWNGTVSVCSLNSTASYEYYIGQPLNYNSVLGSAAYVLASLEAERIGH